MLHHPPRTYSEAEVQLLAYHPEEDLRAGLLGQAAGLPDGSREQRTVLFVVEFLEALQLVEGPTKWVRVRHQSSAAFFPYDPATLHAGERPSNPQVLLDAHPRVCQVQYLLPHEDRPWTWATALAYDLEEAVRLVAAGFAQCEARREYLVVSD